MLLKHKLSKDPEFIKLMKQYNIDATQHQSGQFPGNAAAEAADKAIEYAKKIMGMANLDLDIRDLETALRP